MTKGHLIIEKEESKTKKIKKTPKSLPPEINFPQKTVSMAPSSQTQKLSRLSVCFPDSILQLPQTSALRAYFISQLARIASIFKVDEIVILHDPNYTSKSDKFNPSQYIARNLQYLQTPQYLRKHLFKMHPDLNNVGLMNPIQAHHHLKTDEVCEYREGVTLERPTKKGAGSWVDIGLKQQAKMDQLLPPFVRVTLRLKNFEDSDAMFYEAEAISKKTPRIQKGIYWGYDVRIANSLKQLYKNQDYDMTIVCHHSKLDVEQVQQFSHLNLQGKSILLLLTAAYQPDPILAIDQQNIYQYTIDSYGLGVKKLRIEEQLFYLLSKLVFFTL